MKSLDRFILEAIDRPVRWTWKSYTRDNADVLFTTSSGREVYVEIMLDEEFDEFAVYDIMFSDEEGYTGSRNTGDQFETLATVKDIIEKWIKRQRKPVILSFSGATKRGRLYQRIVTQLSSPALLSKYSLWIEKRNVGVTIYIVDRRIEDDVTVYPWFSRAEKIK